jgi:hypothetical protein
LDDELFQPKKLVNKWRAISAIATVDLVSSRPNSGRQERPVFQVGSLLVASAFAHAKMNRSSGSGPI